MAITGIPLFVITIVELINNQRVQTAGLVRSHISDFLSNPRLYGAFHELIYLYNDDVWKEVKKTVDKLHLDRDQENKTSDMREKAWEALDDINEGHSTGKRFYDPDFFQGSLEEQRLDSVLHYFDMLAYNFNKGLITIDDITGVSGYHLAVIDSRKVIEYYFERNINFWKKLPYEKMVGAEPPYKNLRELLKLIRTRNKKRTGQILMRGYDDRTI